MPLDTGDFLACIIAFAVSTIGIFYTLGINDAKARFDVASLSGTRRANLIFLMPVPAGYLCLLAYHSTAKNNDVPSAISENPSAASAIGNRFSISTAPHKIYRTNQLGAGASSCAHFPIVHESVQTGLD
jgi:hypothetical protein